MKQLSLLLLLSVMLFITGCPLRTAEPIDAGSYTKTDWLLGKWTEQKAGGGDVYLIKKGSKASRLQLFNVTRGDDETDARTIILSSIGKKIFISVSDVDEDKEKGYYIYQLTKLSNTEIELLPVKEYSVSSDAQSKELQTFLNQHIDDDTIYEAKDLVHFKKG